MFSKKVAVLVALFAGVASFCGRAIFAQTQSARVQNFFNDKVLAIYTGSTVVIPDNFNSYLIALYTMPCWQVSQDGKVSFSTIFALYDNGYNGYNLFADFAINNEHKSIPNNLITREYSDSAIKEVQQAIAESSSESVQEGEEISEKQLRRANFDISLYSYDKEILAFNAGRAIGGRVQVTGFDSTFTRDFYDANMRLSKKEYWEMNGVYDSHIVKTQTFEYNDNVLVHSAISDNDNKIFFDYNDAGFLVQQKNYKKVMIKLDTKDTDEVLKTADLLKEDIKFVLAQRVHYQYNSSGKVSEKEATDYFYKENSTKINEKYSVRETFVYKVEKGNPDYCRYENGKLTIKVDYSEKTTYVETHYFDGGFTVESYYIKGDHTKDCYYMNGTLWKEKSFEAQKAGIASKASPATSETSPITSEDNPITKEDIPSKKGGTGEQATDGEISFEGTTSSKKGSRKQKQKPKRAKKLKKTKANKE